MGFWRWFGSAIPKILRKLRGFILKIGWTLIALAIHGLLLGYLNLLEDWWWTGILWLPLVIMLCVYDYYQEFVKLKVPNSEMGE